MAGGPRRVIVDEDHRRRPDYGRVVITRERRFRALQQTPPASPRPFLCNRHRRAHPRHLVAGKVVTDDQLARLQGRPQTLFHVGQEHLSVQRAIDQQRGSQPVVA